jgi:hypothetical protein
MECSEIGDYLLDIWQVCGDRDNYKGFTGQKFRTDHEYSVLVANSQTMGEGRC